jgi:hypothetical protein
MMKKFLLASLAIAVILAIAPSSQADSFSYSVGGSNFAVNPNDGNMILASNNGTLIPLGRNGHEGVEIGAGSSALSEEIGIPFDNLLAPGASGENSRGGAGTLVDISGKDLSLFTGRRRVGTARDGHFYFIDKSGYHLDNEISKGNGTLVGVITTLTETPEPGSLFLLGTGLLCMALVLFWRSARSPKASS